MRSVALLLTLGVVVVASACAGRPDADAGPRADVPLVAADVVECVVPGSEARRRDAVYSEGATADTPDAALDVARSEGGFEGTPTGLRPARREAGRVLYVVEVDGAVKQAVVVRDGPATRGTGGDGWHVESWAVCDLGELPRAYTDSLGLRLWEDASGRPVPVATLREQTGPEHCAWQSMTFLELDGATYVRALLAELRDLVRGAYRAHVAVPAGAVPTDYRRGADRLWTTVDRREVYVGEAADAEAWPRATDDLACA